MIIYDWPTLLTANGERFHLDARTRSGGETINGREQAVGSGLGRWVATLTVPLHTPAKIRAMRSLLAKLDGRSNGVRVGPCDGPNSALLMPQWASVKPILTAPANVGDTAISLELGRTTAFGEGNYIGLAGYLYLVVGVTDLGRGVYEAAVRPKLRVGAGASAQIEVMKPQCPMRLAADDSGAFELQLARTGTATLDLVEVY